MRIERYYGGTATEALSRVRLARGPTALVLGTRTLVAGSGVAARQRTEVAVLAADDEPRSLEHLARHVLSYGGQPRAPGRRVVCLVGPTGVGKTTTVAKLAGAAVLRGDREVGLLTTDTYRVGAVDQLRAYADLLSVPLRIVISPADLRGALRELRDAGLVLVDTTGRSPADRRRIQQLSWLLRSMGQLETHLCLAATTSRRAILSAAARFGPTGFSSVTLTKVDEADDLTEAVEAVASIGAPVSFIACGQEVPDDLLRASPEALLTWGRA